MIIKEFSRGGGYVSIEICTALHCKYMQWKLGQCLHFSTVLGAAIKCKQYSGITVESGTPVKSVKITLNTFAV